MANTNNMIKSPIFYMGNKYDLLYNLLMYFPREEDVNLFIDLFGGSGVVRVNVPYKNVIYNEINHNITNLFKMLIETEPSKTIEHIKNRVGEFDLPVEGIEKGVEGYEKFEKQYYKFREFYNKQKQKNYLDLYTLTYFSFSNLIRFNSKSEFNMPYGHRCYLDKTHEYNIIKAYYVVQNKNMMVSNMDAFELLKTIKQNDNQFIYLDPPYANTMAIYNESRAFGGWNIEHDYKMFSELDRLNDLGIKWAMSNVLVNKGKENNHLKEWAIKNNYTIIDFENKQYSALGKGNAKSQEVLIINYKAPFEQFTIFNFMEDGGKNE